MPASLPLLFDFLELPPSTRRLFPFAKLRDTAGGGRRGRGHRHDHRRSATADLSAGAAARLQHVYGALEAAVERLPPEGLWLRNT